MSSAEIRPAAGAWRSHRWAITGALSVTQTVSWGVLYYAFAVILVPMQDALDASTTQCTGAFSLAVALSAVAGLAVGRYLDRHGPRLLMTAGSVLGAVLVVAWSQVDGLVALYSVWALIGLVMACVLYEPALVVLTKHFHDPAERRRAMTALTVIAATASFIFLPLCQALVDAHGWRTALLILAAILALITIPLHATALRTPPTKDAARASSHGARDVLRSASFWLVSAAFCLASFAAFAVLVLAIRALVDRGYSAEFATFAVGLVGISQIPGRLLFAGIADRLSAAATTTSIFTVMAVGIAVFAAADTKAAVIAGLVALGMSNGMATLSRPTVLADRYGPAAYGSIAGVAAATSTAARAVGPVAAAAYGAAVGFTTMFWTLAAVALAAAALIVVDARAHAHLEPAGPDVLGCGHGLHGATGTHEGPPSRRRDLQRRHL